MWRGMRGGSVSGRLSVHRQTHTHSALAVTKWDVVDVVDFGNDRWVGNDQRVLDEACGGMWRSSHGNHWSMSLGCDGTWR
eukprot:3940238-Rhodomonas_salina.3